MFKVLFVCTGNICRSPTAEGVFRHMVEERGLADRVEADSAGIGSWHVGDPPDPRSTETALARGIDIRDQRARKVRPYDFEEFDLLLAMDSGHHDAMSRARPPDLLARIRLFLEYSPDLGIRDVPDPYYGGPGGFQQVFDLVSDALMELLEAHDWQR